MSDVAREWQPIETAPKDGTPILGWWGLDRYFRGAVVRWVDPSRGWELSWSGERLVDPPTHWQPLPPPPKRSAAQANAQGGG